GEAGDGRIVEAEEGEPGRVRAPPEGALAVVEDLLPVDPVRLPVADLGRAVGRQLALGAGGDVRDAEVAVADVGDEAPVGAEGGPGLLTRGAGEAAGLRAVEAGVV